MKHCLAAVVLTLMSATVSAQSVNPALAQSMRAANTGVIARADPVKLLQDEIAQMKQQIAQLQQANQALAARVQAVDSGLGQVVTQNVAQAKQISDVSSRLASHRHSYTSLDVGWTNEYFVKESGGIGSADKKSLASYVSSKTQQTGTTGPAQ
jgi:septal ring factor EnvC (AmiA/AmiB activator)